MESCEHLVGTLACCQQEQLSSREHSKVIQYFPGPDVWPGSCNTLTAPTGGSDQGWERSQSQVGAVEEVEAAACS